MLLFDRYPLDDAAKVSITKDGYLVATPRVARTGIQLYYGSELGITGKDSSKIFKVYRPEDQVFAKDSMASFAYKPLTDDHPAENVTVDNWKKYSRGQMSGDVARDGDFIRVPMALMDGGLIQKYKDGKAELSMGYECELAWGAGTTPTGDAYDAQQKNIRINHCAVVDAARGGQDLRIGDGTGVTVNLDVYAEALEAIIAGDVDRDSMIADGGGNPNHDPSNGEFSSGGGGSPSVAQMAARHAQERNEAQLGRPLTAREKKKINKRHGIDHLAKDSKGNGIYPILKDGVVYVSSLRANKTDAVTKGDGDAIAALDNLLARADWTTTSAVEDGHKETTDMKIMTVDGISVEVVNDQAAQIIQKALDTASARVKTAEDAYQKASTENEEVKKKMAGDTAKNATDMAAKDAEIATLKKQVEDGKLTPAKLDQLVKDRAVISGKARAVLGDKLVVDAKTDTEIMRQVVDAKLGDTAKGWTDDQVKISFDTLTASVKPVDVQTSGVYDTARAFSNTDGAHTGTEKLLADRDARLANAWKTPVAH